MQSYEIGEVYRQHPDYPVLLNRVPDAPDPLYVLGNCSDLSIYDNTLAVVGSRAVTMYGEWVIETIVKEVARFGVTIVSGFMYGVDALAHKAALAVGGKTIAVMAGNIGNVFPSYQQDLYDDIVANGLVVSERREKGAEGKWMFVRRNRIVAGLSHAVLVVEAGEASGSLITANFAKEYGRQILAIPGNLNCGNSFGTTWLLKDGATLVSCADDVLQLYFTSDNYRARLTDSVNRRLLIEDTDEDAQNVMNMLYLEPLSADEISLKLKIPLKEVLRILTGLSMYNGVIERDGRFYVN